MSLLNNLPLSIVDLNADCLLHMFSYLQLPDLLNIRLQCSTMNDAVCKFLPHLTTLFIVYTEHPDPIEAEPALEPPTKRLKSAPEELTEKPKTLSINDRINSTCRDFYQSSFRREDFIVVSGRQQFEKFLAFIEKYQIGNITKLALIIESGANEFLTITVATDLLKLCPKVETVFLDRLDEKDLSHEEPAFYAEDLEPLFDTIVGLTSLNKLHFFARKHSIITLNTVDMRVFEISDEQQAQLYAMVGNFLLTMFQKLRIFYMNHQDVQDNRPILAPLLGQTFEKIPELGLESEDFKHLVDSEAVFKNLGSLTLFGEEAYWNFERCKIGNSLEQLTVLNFADSLNINMDVLHNLRALPNLEKLNAKIIATLEPDDFNKIVDGDREVFEGVNKTIKHIQVESIYKWSPDAETFCFTKENHNLDVADFDGFKFYAFTDFFQCLQTVTVLQPEVVVYDINSFDVIRIGDNENLFYI